MNLSMKRGVVLAVMLSVSAIASARDIFIDGEKISLREVGKKCEVYKYSDSYGEVDCRGSKFRQIERKCEVYFYDYDNGELECRGSDLRPVERYCSVYMYSESYGDMSC